MRQAPRSYSENYVKGDRVELIHTPDEHTRLVPGTHGTVTGVDSNGTVHMRWDDGSTLGMIPGIDEIRRISE